MKLFEWFGKKEFKGKKEKLKHRQDVDHMDFGHPANEMICNELPVSPDSVACSSDFERDLKEKDDEPKNDVKGRM